MSADVAAAAAVIRSADRIAVAGHVGPDGDALGSMLALARAARNAGKDAWASFGEPFVLPHHFDYLDRSTLVAPGDLPTDIDLFIACDTPVPQRLGTLAPVADGAASVLVIDHHRSDGGFGDVELIDREAAATTQLVFRLLGELGWEIDEPIATALYTGLVTDTGRFQYSATTPEVHHMAAELLAVGVRPELVGQQLFEQAPFGYYAVVAKVMGRAVLESELGLVWSVMYAADRGDVPYQETDGLIDLVRIAGEAGVACLFKEIQAGVFKGSLRSRGLVDVAAIASRLGGGGHHNAAGFTHRGEPEAALTTIRSLLA